MIDNLQLLQTLTARICHDFAGSIGIIDNCLGLSKVKNKVIRKKADLLLHEESNNLLHKVRFFRTIYGIVDNETEITVVNFVKLVNDFFANTNIQLSLNFDDDLLHLETFISKAVMCLMLIGSEHISSSGKIEVFFSKVENRSLVKMVISGTKLRLKKSSFLALAKGAQDISIDINNCREHYIHALCNKIGYSININRTDDILEYSMSPSK